MFLSIQNHQLKPVILSALESLIYTLIINYQKGVNCHLNQNAPPLPQQKSPQEIGILKIIILAI